MNRNFTALILIVISVGVYFTVTRNMIADAQAVKSVNDQYTAALSHATDLLAMRDQVERQWQSISEADRDRLGKMIPSSVDNIRLIIDLNNVASRHGFGLTDVRALAPSQAKPLGSSANMEPEALSGGPVLDTVTVSFKAAAPYDQFVAFLQDLEANLRLMEITHLGVTVGETGGYVFEAELQTYWIRQ